MGELIVKIVKRKRSRKYSVDSRATKQKKDYSSQRNATRITDNVLRKFYCNTGGGNLDKQTDEQWRAKLETKAILLTKANKNSIRVVVREIQDFLGNIGKRKAKLRSLQETFGEKIIQSFPHYPYRNFDEFVVDEVKVFSETRFYFDEVIGVTRIEEAPVPFAEVYFGLPKSLFQKRDFLNYHCFNSWRLFVFYITSLLRKKYPDLVSIKEEDFWMPHIEFQMFIEENESIPIKFMPFFIEGCFPSRRFALSSTNLRTKKGKFESTKYNQRLVAATNQQIFELNPQLRRAYLLIERYWQVHFMDYSNYSMKHRSIQPYHLRILLQYMWNKKKLLASTPEEILKQFIQHIIKTNATKLMFDKNGQVKEEKGKNMNISGLHIIDGNGFNAFWRVSLTEYNFFREISRNVFSNDNPLDRIFSSKPKPVFLEFDLHFILHLKQDLEFLDEVITSGYDITEYQISRLEDCLHEALVKTKRAKYFKVFFSGKDSIEVVVGISLNHQNCDSIIDKGPPEIETEEHGAFIRFWRSKSELRRFSDGQVLEAVLWNLYSNPIDQIMNFVLDTHLAHLFVNWRSIGSTLSDFQNEVGIPQRKSSLSVLKAFESLKQSLLRIRLDLQLRNVDLIDRSLCYTDMFSDRKAISILLKFEKSNRWPLNLTAIKLLKHRFFQDIVEKLNVTRSSMIDKSERRLLIFNGICFRVLFYIEQEDQIRLGKLQQHLLHPKVKTYLHKMKQELGVKNARVRDLVDNAGLAEHLKRVKDCHLLSTTRIKRSESSTYSEIVLLGTFWVHSLYLGGIFKQSMIETYTIQLFEEHSITCPLKGFLRLLEKLSAVSDEDVSKVSSFVRSKLLLAQLGENNISASILFKGTLKQWNPDVIVFLKLPPKFSVTKSPKSVDQPIHIPFSNLITKKERGDANRKVKAINNYVLDEETCSCQFVLEVYKKFGKETITIYYNKFDTLGRVGIAIKEELSTAEKEVFVKSLRKIGSPWIQDIVFS